MSSQSAMHEHYHAMIRDLVAASAEFDAARERLNEAERKVESAKRAIVIATPCRECAADSGEPCDVECFGMQVTTLTVVLMHSVRVEDSKVLSVRVTR